MKDHETYLYLHGTVLHMCEKVRYHQLAWGIWSSRKIPRLNKSKCAEGACEECRVKNLRWGEYKDLTENDNQNE